MQQHRNSQPFWDASALPSSFSANLPDLLRVKPTGLQPHQVGVYEDFGESSYQLVVVFD
jgi:CCR4-NOT transcription complex subunit 1